MSAKTDRVRELIAQEAADWFVANRAGLSASEREQFALWLRSSPLHVGEYLSVTAIARDLRAATESSASHLEELLRQGREDSAHDAEPLRGRLAGYVRDFGTARWRSVGLAAAAVVVAAVGLTLWWPIRPGPEPVVPEEVTTLDLVTPHGQDHAYHLADGSVLHLNSDSRATVRYSRHERQVRLTAGEADFEVAHDVSRPFRVLAGAAEVVAVGTNFDVYLRADATLVTVVNGRITVAPAPEASVRLGLAPGQQPPVVALSAGEQLTAVDGSWPPLVQTADPQRSTAWLHRQIAFEHEPLERVAGEFNRYSSVPIEIASPALRSLEISGVFATDDMDAFIAFLRSLDGVKVDVTATRIRVSQTTPPAAR